MATETIRVRGLREFQRAARRAVPESRAAVRQALKNAAEPVRQDAARRFAVIDARSAAAYRTVVRVRGVAVESRMRRTTGRRPDYGALQMTKALLPALQANERNTERAVEHAIDVIANHFERG